MESVRTVERKAKPFDVTHRSVLAIAVPMTLAYLSTPLLGLVDTAVIGQLGDPALVGAIAIGALAFDFLFTTFNFLRSGTTGLVAQAYGAGDEKEQIATVLRALVLAVFSGVAAILLQGPFLIATLAFLGGSDAVQAGVRDYFTIRIYSAPFALMNYAVLGYFLGIGRAGAGLILQTLLNGLNIVLSISFVLWLEWGVAGVASATVISEFLTAIVGLAWLWRTFGGKVMPSRRRVFNRRRFIRMIAVNRDIMIRSFSLLFAFAFFTARSADQGDVILASNAILEKFFLIGGYFLDGFATAAEQIAGRAVGARYRPAFDRAVRLTLIWGFALAAALSSVLMIGGDHLVAVMTTSTLIRETAATYMIWAVLTPLLGVLAFQMDGVFIGATWSQDMRNMMLVSLAVYLVTYWLAFPVWGNHGLWLALCVFLSIRGVTLAWRCAVRARHTFGPSTA